MEKFDLVIIGGGAAGFAGAIRANELKAKTLLVNSGLPLGGTCVNVGCVPSKRLLYVGEILNQTKKNNIRGLETKIENFDFKKIIENELSLVERLREVKYREILESLEYVDFIEGKARFTNYSKIEVNGQTFESDKFLIATGSKTTIPPVEGIDEVGYLTHISALKISKMPEKLVIVGAGPLGLEFSQIFARFGAKVTILQHASTIFPLGEKTLTENLKRILRREDITIKTDVHLQRVYRKNGKKCLFYQINGKEEEVTGDEILLATGKTPNTFDLGLENVGVKIDKKKAIVVNEYLQTSNPDIYSAGDVINLPLRLETTAGREGTIAVENALNGSNKKIEYSSVPYTIFTDPQLAGVGLTEEEVIKKYGTCACRTLYLEDLPKAIITERTEGMVKIIINPENEKILGIHILSPNAGDLISQAMVVVKYGLTIDNVIDTLPVFPTLSEAIKICALSFKKDISKLSCCI